MTVEHILQAERDSEQDMIDGFTACMQKVRQFLSRDKESNKNLHVQLFNRLSLCSRNIRHAAAAVRHVTGEYRHVIGDAHHVASANGEATRRSRTPLTLRDAQHIEHVADRDLVSSMSCFEDDFDVIEDHDVVEGHDVIDGHSVTVNQVWMGNSGEEPELDEATPCAPQALFDGMRTVTSTASRFRLGRLPLDVVEINNNIINTSDIKSEAVDVWRPW